MNSRLIYSSPGYPISKPVRSIPGIAVISVLLGLQLAGLVWLAVYSSSAPTWTSTLNAVAMAEIGRQLEDVDISPLGVKHKKNDMAALTGTEGIVGVVEKDGGAMSETSLDRDETLPVLGLGAPGVITSDIIPKKRKMSKGDGEAV